MSIVSWLALGAGLGVAVHRTGPGRFPGGFVG
jgi:hypothetical protein